MPDHGDIVLIPIPFTDLSSNKRRPVIVVSNAAYLRSTRDMIVVAMTSNPSPVEYGFSIDSQDLESGSLNHPGMVRVDKIYALSQSLVVKSFGRVKVGVLERIRLLLQDLTTNKGTSGER